MLRCLIYDSKFYIKDSFELVKYVRNFNIDGAPNNSKLISLDVASLFTNVPLDLALHYISSKFHLIDTCIPKIEFLAMIRFIFESSNFTFQGNIFNQVFCCTMGSPLSRVLADIAMFVLEEEVLNSFGFEVPIYFR